MASTPDSIEKHSKDEVLDHQAKNEKGALHAEDVGSAPRKVEKPIRPTFPGTAVEDSAKLEKRPDDPDVRILTEDECYEELGFCFPEWKKWMILTGGWKDY